MAPLKFLLIYWLFAYATERNNFVQMIKGSSAAASLYGAMYETICHKVFSNGGKFNLISLPSAEEASYKKEIAIPSKTYKLLPIKTESIDGFYLSNEMNELLLMQITVAASHPVNANGIAKFIIDQNFKESFEDGILRVSLVFVVPLELQNYSRQNIRFQPGEEEGIGLLRKIEGIGKERAAKLYENNIKSLNQFIES